MQNNQIKVYVVIKAWYDDMEDTHPSKEVYGVYANKQDAHAAAHELSKQHATWGDFFEQVVK